MTTAILTTHTNHVPETNTRVAKAAATALKALKQHRQRRRAIAELRAMSDRDLRDIGIHRQGISFTVGEGDSHRVYTD